MRMAYQALLLDGVACRHDSSEGLSTCLLLLKVLTFTLHPRHPFLLHKSNIGDKCPQIYTYSIPFYYLRGYLLCILKLLFIFALNLLIFYLLSTDLL